MKNFENNKWRRGIEGYTFWICYGQNTKEISIVAHPFDKNEPTLFKLTILCFSIVISRYDVEGIIVEYGNKLRAERGEEPYQ